MVELGRNRYVVVVAARTISPNLQFSVAFAGRAGNLRPAMTPHEEPSPAGESPVPQKRAGTPRRSRRGGRGRRRSGARREGGPASAAPLADTTTPSVPSGFETSATESTLPEAPIDDTRGQVAGDAVSEHHEFRGPRDPEPREERLPAPERTDRHDFRPASPAAVAEAIEEVTEIIASLRQVLDQMDEVLETLELAEVQKTADEREIQSLRNALRQLDRRNTGSRPEPPAHEQRSSEPRRDRRR